MIIFSMNYILLYSVRLLSFQLVLYCIVSYFAYLFQLYYKLYALQKENN